MTASARRSKDVFTSLAGIQTAHAELLKRHRTVGDAPDILAEITDFMQKAMAAGALLDGDSDRWSAQSVLDYWATTVHRATDVLPEATLADFDPALAPTLDDSLCPYLGLDAFKADQKDRYFGRQQLVDHLVERLVTGRLLALIGPSGSGKSSLILAGVLPALQNGAVPGSDQWNYLPPIVPGAEPLESLARMVLPPNTDAARVAAVAAEFRKDPGHLVTVLGRQVQPTLVVVDQFEEVLTLCRDDVARQAFVDNVLRVTKSDEPRHTVILTMRDDFMGQVSRLPALAGQFERVLTVVVPPTAAELRDAIEKPALQIGLKFEDGLVDQLLKDVVDEPAGLPLLQFTLLKLWEARDHNRITRRVYDRLGGGRECLARSADEVWVQLGLPENQEAGKRILLELVRPEGRDFTSKRVRRERLYKIGIPANRITLALERLVAARLLRVTPGESEADDRIEVAHEALVRNWPKLSAWLEEERERMRHRIALTAKAEEWENRGRDRNLLLRGEVLQEATNYEELGEVESAYVQASLAERERVRRMERLRRGVMAALIAIILVGSVAASVVLWRSSNEMKKLAANERIQRLRADSAALLANVAMTRAQVGESTATRLGEFARAAQEVASASRDTAFSLLGAAQAATTADKSPDLSVLLALNAMSIGRTNAAERALDRSVRAWGLPLAMRHDRPTEIRSIAVSRDTQWLATATDSTIQFWNLRNHARGRTLIGHTDIVRDLVFDSSSTRLFTASDDSTIKIWEVASGRLLGTWAPHVGKVLGLAMSPNGKWLASAGTTGRTVIWDLGGRQVAELKNSENSIWALAFNPASTRLITATNEGDVWIWNTQSWSIADTLGGSPAVRDTQGILSVAYSRDGLLIATGSLDSTARIWPVRGGAPRIIKMESQVWSVAFSPDGSRLATGTQRGEVRLWDAGTSTELRTLQGHNSVVYVMTFLDRSHFFSADRRGNVILWDLSGDLEAQRIKPAGALYSLAMSYDGKRVAAGSNDSRIWMGEQAAGSGVADSLRSTGGISSSKGRKILRSLSFNSSGTLLASVDPDTLKLWDVKTRGVLWTRALLPAAPDTTRDSTAAAAASDSTRSADFWGVAVSPDGRFVATASLDGTLRIFEGTSGRVLHEVKRDSNQVVSVAFNPRQPNMLVSSGQDHLIHIWNAETGQEQQTLAGHDNPVLRLAFDSTGNSLVSSSIDGTARVWDFTKPVPTTRLVLTGHRNWVWDASFSRDGQFVATSSSDSTVRIWDLANGEEIRSITLPGTTSQAIEFGPRNRLVMAGVDGTIRVYPIASIDPTRLMATARAHLERTFTEQECTQRFRRACPATAESFLVEARDAARQGRRGAAYAAFRRAEAKDPALGIDADQYLRPLLLTAAMEQGTNAAASGDLQAARARFRDANALDPSLKLDPELEASRIADARAQSSITAANRAFTASDFAAAGAAAWDARRANVTIARKYAKSGLFGQSAAALAQSGRVADGIDMLDFALATDSSQVQNFHLNGVCWFGALRKMAARVVGYCDRAVRMDSTVTGIRDSRGVARALTGDVKGAIEDFEAYLADTRNAAPSRERRRGWVAALNRGTPVATIFSDQVLTSLLSE